MRILLIGSGNGFREKFWGLRFSTGRSSLGEPFPYWNYLRIVPGQRFRFTGGREDHWPSARTYLRDLKL
jgi:hypothetical protein